MEHVLDGLMIYLLGKLAIFHSYIKLPDGRILNLSMFRSWYGDRPKLWYCTLGTLKCLVMPGYAWLMGTVIYPHGKLWPIPPTLDPQTSESAKLCHLTSRRATSAVWLVTYQYSLATQIYSEYHCVTVYPYVSIILCIIYLYIYM